MTPVAPTLKPVRAPIFIGRTSLVNIKVLVDLEFLAYNNGNLNLVTCDVSGTSQDRKVERVCFERSSIWICLSENTTNKNHKKIREDLLQYEDFLVVANFDH
ncbi:hypothetical protein K435DRAFT_809286 [Dendrothele bispora CBS 962.96]|uniref:Uncharacterized protein n=1 Tax=Dendrothele bispora (strain CBS 962.96) TaxID=1314807 RepID=A0A4S8KYR2_DENBC|nr:hypothetical protein K435DRAFT_809286 [Dendrothele bispora CBS 962.96]